MDEISFKLLDEFRTIISEHIDPVSEKLDHVNDHLKTLNGQVAKNTSFRAQMNIWLKVAAFAVASAFTFLTIWINTMI